MAPKQAIRLLAGGEGEGEVCESDNIIGLEFGLLGRALKFRIFAPNRKVPVAQIVPVAREISDAVTRSVVQQAQSRRERIPCGKGCDACCRALVPLSPPEMFCIMDDIEGMAIPVRKALRSRLLLAAREVLKEPPPASFAEAECNWGYDEVLEAEVISRWYASLGVVCPFLGDGECTIYARRPMACREHFVKGSAGACRGEAVKAKLVASPVAMTNVLSKLEAQMHGAESESVMLPLLLPWCEENSRRRVERRPGREIVEYFVEIVRETADENTWIPLSEKSG